jgi:hypothetical protein
MTSHGRHTGNTGQATATLEVDPGRRHRDGSHAREREHASRLRVAPRTTLVRADRLPGQACQSTSCSTRLVASRRENAAKISLTPWKMAHTPTKVTSVSSDR